MLRQVYAVMSLLLLNLLIPCHSAYATSTFQNSCSNIHFSYVENLASIQADCLKDDGSVEQAELILQGISNQNGKLIQGSGSSSFQKSCGNIQININSTDSVSISAYCKNDHGSSLSTSLPLNGIRNQDGKLVQ